MEMNLFPTLFRAKALIFGEGQKKKTVVLDQVEIHSISMVFKTKQNNYQNTKGTESNFNPNFYAVMQLYKNATIHSTVSIQLNVVYSSKRG